MLLIGYRIPPDGGNSRECVLRVSPVSRVSRETGTRGGSVGLGLDGLFQLQIPLGRGRDAALGGDLFQQGLLAAGLHDTCRVILRVMETGGQQALLGEITAQTGITPPAQRYLQLKEAIEAQAD